MLVVSPSQDGPPSAHNRGSMIKGPLSASGSGRRGKQGTDGATEEADSWHHVLTEGEARGTGRALMVRVIGPFLQPRLVIADGRILAALVSQGSNAGQRLSKTGYLG